MRPSDPKRKGDERFGEALWESDLEVDSSHSLQEDSTDHSNDMLDELHGKKDKDRLIHNEVLKQACFEVGQAISEMSSESRGLRKELQQYVGMVRVQLFKEALHEVGKKVDEAHLREPHMAVVQDAGSRVAHEADYDLIDDSRDKEASKSFSYYLPLFDHF